MTSNTFEQLLPITISMLKGFFKKTQNGAKSLKLQSAELFLPAYT